MGDETEISALLERLREGSPEAHAELFERLHGELQRIADALFRRQPAGHTLEPTALVSEAWLRMAGSARAYNDRAHFLAVAARAMRQVLVNHGRDRAALKRGGGRARQRLTVIQPVAHEGDPAARGAEVDLLALDEALDRLRRLDPRQAQIAELRFFSGLSTREVAEVLGVSTRTVELDWKMAKDQLARWLAETGAAPD